MGFLLVVCNKDPVLTVTSLLDLELLSDSLIFNTTLMASAGKLGCRMSPKWQSAAVREHKMKQNLPR